MSDLELLELAARAAGLTIKDSQRWANTTIRRIQLDDGSENWIRWNPLEDDGDAFRLAVKLGIAVYPPESDGDDATCNGPYPLSCWHSETVLNGDSYAATRRAITRAAAEIQRQRESK